MSQACEKQVEQQATFCLFGLLFEPEDGGHIFLQNVSKFVPDCTTLHLRRLLRIYILNIHAFMFSD
jgi:hypothetical protein